MPIPDTTHRPTCYETRHVFNSVTEALRKQANSMRPRDALDLFNKLSSVSGMDVRRQLEDHAYHARTCKEDDEGVSVQDIAVAPMKSRQGMLQAKSSRTCNTELTMANNFGIKGTSSDKLKVK